MKYGVGKWVQILETGLLPGKLIQQLNGQTQRLIGQQSLAAYTGLQVDIDRVRADNEARVDAPRKAGLIINTGKNLTREDKDRLQQETRANYGLTKEQMKEVEEQLDEIKSQQAENNAANAAPTTKLMTDDPIALDRTDKLALLKRLHTKLSELCAQMTAKIENNNAVPPPQQQQQQQKHVASCPESDGENRETNSAPQSAQPMSIDVSVAAVPKKRNPPSKKRIIKKRQLTEDSDSDDDFMSDDDIDKKPSSRGGGRNNSKQHQKLQIPTEMIDSLTGMGFSQRQAKDALEETGGDVEAAIEWLMSCVA